MSSAVRLIAMFLNIDVDDSTEQDLGFGGNWKAIRRLLPPVLTCGQFSGERTESDMAARGSQRIQGYAF